FILAYALYWSKGFDLFQNIVVTIVSLAVSALLIGAMWLMQGGDKIEMVTRKKVLRWTGIGFLVAGAILALAPLFFGYLPISNPAWWGLNFDVFWFGIVDVAIGASLFVESQAITEPGPDKGNKVEIAA
ncbi:MAG TPA: hypothetical protein VJN71_08610, partial [Nitrososphaerales archaeon]|nr:hypothetical protein [Nitrososphaerales archaeon]